MLHDQELDNGGTSPFSAYCLLSTTFNSGVIGLAGATAVLGRLKTPVAAGDLITMGLAAHSIARILTKERVTMPLRAPFTKQEDHGRKGGHDSTPRGHGMQRALGELLTCPHCIAPWVALGLMAGHVVAPQPTRAITTLFSTVALATAFHHAYAWLDGQQTQARRRAERIAQEAPPESGAPSSPRALRPEA